MKQEPGNEPVPVPPARLFRLVHYASPIGNLAAYVSQPPASGTKHPAMIWIFGGFGNGIGETAWEAASPANDQSARAFREAGIVTMYPSLRGGNNNPGYPEGFYGEVDDVLAAADYLARQPFVDPRRLYLGGHSTGGTLALLVAALDRPVPRRLCLRAGGGRCRLRRRAAPVRHRQSARVESAGAGALAPLNPEPGLRD